MKFRKKIILAGFSVLLLLITTVTTTFAWFSLNDTVWVDDMELEIYNADSLLVKHESGNYKQMLTNNDIVEAINDERELGDQISKLDDISLSEVFSSNGSDFYKLVPSYDDMNRKTISFDKADLNSYIQFRLTFKVETSMNASVHPTYYLMLSDTDSDEGLKKTSFTSDNQTLKLLNSLVTQDKEYVMDDSITVNPVNALRLSIKGDSASKQSADYIYDLAGEDDLGSYAIDERILEHLEIVDQKYNSSKNAGFTYYNNINNNILNPLGYFSDDEEKVEQVENISGLFTRLKYDFTDSLGVFEYNQDTQNYNEVTLVISIWIEGFDADNLIGLDSSIIKCLLSFRLVEGGNVRAIYS